MPAYPSKRDPAPTRNFTPTTPKKVAPPPFFVRVICTDWLPQLETKLTADLLNMQQSLAKNRQIVLMFDPKEAKRSAAFNSILPSLGVAVKEAPVDPDKERELTTLVYYTKRQEKPPSLCNRDNLFYRYIGSEARTGDVFTPFKITEQVFPDRTRPLPPAKSLTTRPAPQQLNYQSKLPQWLQNGPMLG